MLAPDPCETDHARLGLEVELRHQDIDGFGLLASAEGELRLAHGLGLIGWVGDKDGGYALGRAIERTAFGALGMSYRFDHRRGLDKALASR